MPDVDGRAVIAWTPWAHGTLERADRRGPVIDRAIAGMHARLLQPGADGPDIVDLPSADERRPCLTARSRVDPRPRRGDAVAPDKPVVEREAFKSTVLARLHAGSPRCFAIAYRRSSRSRSARMQTCRVGEAMPPGAPDFSATTVVGGKLVAIASHGGVLGVWREDGPVGVHHGLPAGGRPGTRAGVAGDGDDRRQSDRRARARRATRSSSIGSRRTD